MYRYFIGSNNKTNKVEENKIRNKVCEYADGFTMYRCDGYWKGTKEKSVIVEIEGLNSKKAHELAKNLCVVLKQEAVGVQKVNGVTKFISE